MCVFWKYITCFMCIIICNIKLKYRILFDKNPLRFILYKKNMKGGFFCVNLNEKKIGFVITGSFYTFKRIINEMKEIVKKGAKIVPIMSENSYSLDTKYGKAIDFVSEIENITKCKVIHTIQEMEKTERNCFFDILVIAPATSNTISKLANDIIERCCTLYSKVTYKI